MRSPNASNELEKKLVLNGFAHLRCGPEWAVISNGQSNPTGRPVAAQPSNKAGSRNRAPYGSPRMSGASVYASRLCRRQWPIRFTLMRSPEGRRAVVAAPAGGERNHAPRPRAGDIRTYQSMSQRIQLRNTPADCNVQA